jgi:septation ring formation regulator EzrA
MTPADEEREKAYSLAENLNFQLDDMSSQLSTLISEMNALSSQTETEDDPLTMITRILGEHLSSLEWVNASVGDLESRLKDLNHVSGIAQTEAERLHRGVLESKSFFSS